MSWYDYVPSVPFQIGNAMFGSGDVAAWANGKQNVPQMGQNPFMGDWRNLISQLQNQATGNGPSVAGDAYKQASQDTMNNIQSTVANGSAGGARQGIQAMGKVNQGLAQGYDQAKLQEMMAGRSALSGALQGAGQAWQGPAMANFQAQLGAPSNMQKLLALFQQMGPMVGAMGA